MAITTEYLTPEITAQLYDYQVNALTREINDYLQLNRVSKRFRGVKL